MHRVRLTVVNAKQSPLSPGHRLPRRLGRQIPQPSSLSLSLLSLSVRIRLQEPRCCLWAMPRVPSAFQGVSQPCITLLLPGSCLSLPGSHGALAARLSGVASHCRTRLWGRAAIFMPLVAQRDPWDKGTPFCQPVTLRTHVLWQVG